MDPEVRAFYMDGFGEDERLRLRAHGVLERVRTQELLARLLPPPPATVLDVGGGTGVHADWLAQRGYSVHLIDPVEEHVAVAGRLPNVSSAVGDARCLSQADESQDAVLLLGPLYHLPEREGRLQALREARRVARPGAPLVAAGISRFATLMDIGRTDASPRRSSHFCTDCMRPGSSAVTSSALRPRISTFPTSWRRTWSMPACAMLRCTASKALLALPCARLGWTASTSASTRQCGRLGWSNATQ
jgi:ubiquinone/menaquinone biosynthesis C-methylase UbiE